MYYRKETRNILSIYMINNLFMEKRENYNYIKIILTEELANNKISWISNERLDELIYKATNWIIDIVYKEGTLYYLKAVREKCAITSKTKSLPIIKS